jgi:hypothetical protein
MMSCPLPAEAGGGNTEYPMDNPYYNSQQSGLDFC